MPSLRLLIPTFNRACQLECLLRSIQENVSTPDELSICAFFRHTGPEYAAAYEVVKREYPKVEFVEQRMEQSFKTQIQRLIGDREFFGTIADDMVVIDPFGVQDQPFRLLGQRQDIFSLSLRLDAAKTFSQPINECAKLPKHDADLVWRWKPRLPRSIRITRFVDRFILKSAFYDWEFPCALDGSVYRTELFRRFFDTVDDFENIPFIERQMTKALRHFSGAPRNMIRYPRSKTLSLAMNSVDVYHDYPSLGLDPQQFNERFLAGERLDYAPFQKIVFHACHIACEPFWMPNKSA